MMVDAEPLVMETAEYIECPVCFGFVRWEWGMVRCPYCSSEINAAPMERTKIPLCEMDLRWGMW